jgi:hypothetical protein
MKIKKAATANRRGPARNAAWGRLAAPLDLFRVSVIGRRSRYFLGVTFSSLVLKFSGDLVGLGDPVKRVNVKFC